MCFHYGCGERQTSFSYRARSRTPAQTHPYNTDMRNHNVFTHVDADLMPVLEELRRREPIFHTPEFGTTRADFERVTAPGYWEVGASGRRYSREFILLTLEKNPPADATAVAWQTYDYGLRRLGRDTYLFTYTLQQTGRLTRRATIWERGSEGWRILYHQGTIVSAEEDDMAPSRQEVEKAGATALRTPRQARFHGSNTK